MPGGADMHGGIFSDREIAAFLSLRAEINAILEFEAALARVQSSLGVIPADAGAAITTALEGLHIDPASLAETTARDGVIVPGLVSVLRETIGPPLGGYVHWGATSQDAIDTGLVLRLRNMLDILETRLRGVTASLADLAQTHAGLPMAARTRCQTATPTTFGLRIAGWLAPLDRCFDRLDEMRPRLLAVQLGGASGTLAALGGQGIPTMEALAAGLNLVCPAKPWHSERDSVVELANWLAMVSGLLGRIGADLVLLSRSEIAEVVVPGGGSSTMPQKSNPVLAEALVTLARTSAAQAGLAQAALLSAEERDGAAWAVEWQALPSLLASTGASLRHAATLLDSLTPDPDRMAQSLAANGGAIHAEALAFALARQMPLPEAQALVKAAAGTCAREGGSLRRHVAIACEARGLTAPELPETAPTRTARDLISRTIRAADPA